MLHDLLKGQKLLEVYFNQHGQDLAKEYKSDLDRISISCVRGFLQSKIVKYSTFQKPNYYLCLHKNVTRIPVHQAYVFKMTNKNIESFKKLP